MLQFVSKIICSEIFARYCNNWLISHFKINNTKKLVAKKYFSQPTLKNDKKNYIKNFNIYLALEIIKSKLHRNI